MAPVSMLTALLSGLGLAGLAPPRGRTAAAPWLLLTAAAVLSLAGLVAAFSGSAALPVSRDWLPGAPAAASSLLLSIALLLSAAGGRARVLLAQVLGLAVLLLLLVTTVGYLFSVGDLYLPELAERRGLSIPGSLSLGALALGLFYLHPGQGLMTLLHSAGPGGFALRCLLPAALLVPLLLMLLMGQGLRAGWFGVEAGSALVALLAVLITSGLLVWLAVQQGHRRVVEVQRARAEAHFRVLFDNIGDAVFIHDAEGRFLAVNRIACERLGYSSQELLGRSSEDIEVPEFAALGPRFRDAVLRDGHALYESAHLTKDGRCLPVELNARLIQFEGRPAVISLARDIGPRRALQAEARALLDASGESAFLVDRDGAILALNETAARRFGLSRHEMEGGDVFSFMPPAVAENRRQKMEEVLRTRQPVTFRDERQGRHFSIRINPVLGPDGQVERVAVYATDVTERQQLKALDDLFHEIDRRVLSGMALTELLEFICARLVGLFHLGYAWIGHKLPGGDVEFVAGSGPASGYRRDLEKIGVRWDLTAQGSGPMGVAIRTGHPQTVRAQDPGFHPWRDAAGRHGLQAVQALPLVVRGEIYGALGLYAVASGSFESEGVTDRLVSVASRICVALENALDQEQLRLLGTALATAGNAVFITDRHGRIEWANTAFSRMTGYTLAEVLGRNPRFLKSGTQPEAYYRQLWATIQAGVTWNGEAVERHKDGGLFTVQQTITPIRDDQGQIGHYISILEDITPQKEAEARIQHMAHFDVLTDLPNRFLFADRLSQAASLARRGEHQAALMFLDLDGFKAVNDRLGHHVGDLLLQGVALRLRGCVRESDTVARLAGDEFTVLLPDVSSPRDAVIVAKKITGALARPFALEGHEVRISTSIGIAMAPNDTADAEPLLKLADAAMYRAKQTGPGRWHRHGD